jgi:hypothetical protein
MKTHCRLLFFLSVFLLQTAISYAQTYTVAGIVVDDKGAPMMSVNIYIRETLEGTSSREDGSFDFKTTAKGEITLCAQMLGYTPAYMKGEASGMRWVHLVLHPQNVALQEVFVTAGNYRLQGSSKWKEMSPVSIATTAGAVGDIYNGIALLPGVQAAGESGKLMVLGGAIALWVYVQNQFFMTNESVIQEIQESLVSRHEQTVSLGSIEDASFRKSGIMQTLFDYGTIRLSTEGEETTYIFHYVANPKKQVAILNNAIEAFKNGRPVSD